MRSNLLGRRARRAAFVMCGSLGLFACGGGESLREQRAGGDSYLEPAVDPDGGVTNGALGVDPETETTFVLQTRVAPEGTLRKTLLAVSPDDGSTRQVARLDRQGDTRVLFPRDGVLVMSETVGRERLSLYDPRTLALRREASVDVRYHGTRLSPSRRFVAVADNTSGRAIHVIEHDTLRTTLIPHGGGWVEAMWQRNEDRLIVASQESLVRGAESRVALRLMVFDMARVRANDYATEGSFWRGPLFDVTVPDVGPALFFSFTWIAVSADDAFAVIPVSEWTEDEAFGAPRLCVLDLRQGGASMIDDAAGPVGITPDGSTIVSYRATRDDRGVEGSELVLIDRASLRRTTVPVPFAGRPVYHTTRSGHRVVLSSTSDGVMIRLYDIAMNRMSVLAGAPARLGDFVVRERDDTLFTLDRGLVRLSLAESTSERISLGWTPAHLNYLPRRDLLVLDVPGQSALRFWSPSDRRVTRSAALPAP